VMFTKNQQSTDTTLEQVECSMAGIIDRVDALDIGLPRIDQDMLLNNTREDDHDDEEEVDVEEPFNPPHPPPHRQHHDYHQVHHELPRHPCRPTWQGMGGHRHRGFNHQHRCGNDDPFAKVKFTIPPFYGLYDAEAYLDWEMTVDNKFSSRLVPEQYCVRQATSEFKDFAIIWWNELSSLHLHPDTWDRLKAAMRERFVPPAYQRNLRKKMQRSDQGNMFVQNYYAEFQKGMIRSVVHEEIEDKISRFYFGLHTKIQDIVDYKEYNTVNHLFQLAMLVEKEFQGREPMKLKTSFTPRSTSTTPSRTATPSGAHSSMMNSAS
jgi:hypothetical protein